MNDEEEWTLGWRDKLGQWLANVVLKIASPEYRLGLQTLIHRGIEDVERDALRLEKEEEAAADAGPML